MIHAAVNRTKAHVTIIRLHTIHVMRTVAFDDPGVCQAACLSRGLAVQRRLNGSTSGLVWTLLGTRESLYYIAGVTITTARGS